MKGVTFLTDETNRKRFVQIDLSTINKSEEHLEDIFDVIIAEARKDEDVISRNTVKKHLRKKGETKHY